MTGNGIPTTVLIDSSFLFALNNPKDKNREKARAVSKLNISRQIVPDIVLAETAFLLRHRIDQATVLIFLATFAASSAQLEAILKLDLVRAREIMATYSKADLDLADCCIMAISERLNITHICTFDHRDFGMFKPKHCDYLTLLPLMLPGQGL